MYQSNVLPWARHMKRTMTIAPNKRLLARSHCKVLYCDYVTISLCILGGDLAYRMPRETVMVSTWQGILGYKIYT